MPDPSTRRGDDEAAASRREFLALGSAAVAAASLSGLAARGQTPENAAKGERDASANDPGPENKPVLSQNADGFLPPPTDQGEVQSFWNSFSAAHRHIQEGGWSRQVNVEDFPISKEIAGVNMRLTAGGVRELHWHTADEWAFMLGGRARLTAFDLDGLSYVNDVGEGDLWYFPAGVPHSIQGLGGDGCEFLLVFDEGNFSEGNTTQITDWVAHTPRPVLAKNWNVPDSALDVLSRLPPAGRFIFQAPVPGPLENDRRAAAGAKKPSGAAFDFRLPAMAPTKKTRSGEVRVVDSRNFPASANIAAAHVVVKPGGLRELHWHPNADEWQYYIKGKGRMTLFVNGGKARTADFNANDVGYVPRTLGHYVENTGDTDLVFLEMFKTDRYQDLSLSDWMTHTPPELVMQHLRISKETLDAIPKENLAIVPNG